MLPRTGFGDDALGAQALCKQRLTHGVIDFVRACMSKIFAFEPDFGSPALAQIRGSGESGRAAHPSF
jgi:hypothetical protein